MNRIVLVVLAMLGGTVLYAMNCEANEFATAGGCHGYVACSGFETCGGPAVAVGCAQPTAAYQAAPVAYTAAPAAYAYAEAGYGYGAKVGTGPVRRAVGILRPRNWFPRARLLPSAPGYAIARVGGGCRACARGGCR